eukprot:CAMPEP_0119034286 /NCGR_PEP_ID=MMETSP1177-20130426/1284_1 /TAXON_ID=2985 /ORGANISM="Ochromonas sp, Strain CCMP1899" /LENGTH=1580 /DNA_ID=CAMNT_0006991613 /DNA_START=41 /DNA_END=4783 /DNA_ORIENTATION=-
MERKTKGNYQSEYEKLGTVRQQQDVPEKLPQETKRRKPGDKFEKSEFEKFWGLQRDLAWAELPGRPVFNKKTKTTEFLAFIPQILLHLAPASAFNPNQIWIEEQAKEAALLLEEQQSKIADANKGAKRSKVTEVKKADKMKEANTKKMGDESFVADITRIRNSKNSLYSLLGSIRKSKTRLVLMVEIMKKAFDNNEKELVYEALWAIEEVGILEFDAPQPGNERDIFGVRDPSLVYDKFSNVEKLLDKVHKLKSKEKDMVKLQLLDMSNSLPPLSKFTYGFSLDPWQRRVLKWIEADKNVIICAPTSSGKTVLSSFVALIGKHEKASPVTEKKGEKMLKDKKKDDDDDSDDDDDNEDDGGEEAEEAEEEFNSLLASQNDDEEESDHLTFEKDFADLDEKDDYEENVGVNDARADMKNRNTFRNENSDGMQRVLFVVPSEPLVWQVAAYFSQLLREEGDRSTKVALVTDQLTFNPLKKFDVMPQIVVGTPMALESSLTKARGYVGRKEVYKKSQGDSLPGGFDHFDWVIFDEVHALDGDEGEALQRLIRAMSCKFLALSATVGNAEELRGWLERVKGDQILGVECIDVLPEDVSVAVVPVKGKVQGGGLSVQVIKTLDNNTITIDNISVLTTVHDLKKMVEERWTLTEVNKQQLLFGDKDLGNDMATLESYGVFKDTNGSIPVIRLYSLVNMLTHQGRFINLQRYVWSNGGLKVLSPLAAVDNITSLQNGVLASSSLSMTSKDSFQLWEEMSRIFPLESVNKASPYSFFGTDERITLQRTKDYEDLLKKTLYDLSHSHPVETHELLYNFRLEDPLKEFDVCDLVLDLKERDMLPCLIFHLNAFEAIKLLQSLLAGLEYRQKQAYPTYYMDKVAEKNALKKEADAAVKSTGKNAKELEERMKSGEIAGEQDFSVDPYEPHPDFRFCKGAVMVENEWVDLADQMEKYDGFDKREAQAIKERPGKNTAILEHALMRGLRRGIGLYIKEVSSPAYRREVQRLASKGKLAIVVSDDSLAFGVNMPFRTCVFAGEMNGELTPLMAQQMSGRAGRRGLDTQGNLVYVGSKASFIRTLMIGKVSEITGEGHEPRYETMFLQGMLSSRYAGWGRGDVIGGRTLQEYCGKRDCEKENYTLDYSKKVLTDLGLIEDNGSGVFQPHRKNKISYGSINVVWEMRNSISSSVTLGRMLPDLYEFMLPVAHTLSEKRNRDRILVFVSSFFSIFLQMVDRHPCKEGDVPLDQNPYFSEAKPKEVFNDWNEKFRVMQENIPEYLSHLRSPVPAGAPLDGKLFQCVLDRYYMFSLNYQEKQEIKARFWVVGNALKVLHNVLWPHRFYYSVLEVITRNCFKHIFYLNQELVRAQIDFKDVSAMGFESRTDTDKSTVKPLQANMWRDLLEDEPPNIFPTTYSEAMVRSIERFKSWRTANPTAAVTDINAELDRTARIFNTLSSKESPKLGTSSCKLIRISVDYSDAGLPAIIETCSYVGAGEGASLRIIGALAWFCLRLRPSVVNKFPMFLKGLYESDLEALDEATIKAWYTNTANVPEASYTPAGADITTAEMAKLRVLSAPFIQWVESAEDEDDDEDED